MARAIDKPMCFDHKSGVLKGMLTLMIVVGPSDQSRLNLG
jgi:hypothetical protein